MMQKEIRLLVPDLERAVVFYAELLGNRGERTGSKTHTFTDDTHRFYLTEQEEEDETFPRVFSLPMDDLAAVHQVASNMLCLQVDEEMPQPGGPDRRFSLTDPFGNRVHLYQNQLQTA